MYSKTIYYGFATRAVMSGLVITFATGASIFGQDYPMPVAPPAYKAVEPANRGLDANLYMQTAAEYRACCYQAYNLATFRLKEALAKQKTGKFAVVMDLDETVLDNAGFQSMLLRSGLAFDQRLWDAWEKRGSSKIALIPGAKEFILGARKLGVSVIYISNRDDKFRDEVKKALTRLEIPVEDDSLLKLSTGSNDKTPRFEEAERDYTVLLYVGDSLRDFDETLRCSKIENETADELERAIKARKDAVDKQEAIWGQKWIILSNPAYGEWTKPLGRGRSDFDRLVPSAAQIPLPADAIAKCKMTFLIPLVLIVFCIIWTLFHWPSETDLGDQPTDRAKLREFLVLDIRATNLYSYWYLALIGVMAAIAAANKGYFSPILNQEHLWPFGLSFLAASLALLFVPAGYGTVRARNLRLVWLRNVLCEQVVVIFTCYGIWEAFWVLTSTMQ
jgi:5'-nucleotidase (lipoprotein e(P4) family)